MKVRACWSALENKAERKIALLRDETTRAQALRQSLLGSQVKLEEMYKEYHEKNAALSDTKGMTETMNQRQFMSQLLNLRERVQGDLQRSEFHLANLGAHMVAAETERLKMQTLTENDRLAVEKFVQKREQSRMDEMGVMQFNRAQSP